MALMTSTDLKPQHQTTIVGQAMDNVCLAAYYKSEILPHVEKMEAWEVKEYTKGYNDCIEALKENKEYLIANKSLFNEILSQYNMCVAVFTHKYINPVIF